MCLSVKWVTDFIPNESSERSSDRQILTSLSSTSETDKGKRKSLPAHRIDHMTVELQEHQLSFVMAGKFLPRQFKAFIKDGHGEKTVEIEEIDIHSNSEREKSLYVPVFVAVFSCRGDQTFTLPLRSALT